MGGRRMSEDLGEGWALRAHGEVAKQVDGEEGLTSRPWTKLKSLLPNGKVKAAVKGRVGWLMSVWIAP